MLVLKCRFLWGYIYMCTSTADSLCCTAEANTTLSSSYASTEVHVKGELLDVVPAGGPDVQPFGSRLQGPALT